MSKKLTLDEFISRSNKVHDFKYDYSIVEYINCLSKIKIICKKHKIFEQTPANHLFGQGCPICVGKNKNKTTLDIIKEFKDVCGNTYDYSLVIYKNCRTKVKIICPEHGIFEQTPILHLNGSKCPKCVGGVKHSLNDFIDKSKKCHGDKYDYSLVEYKNARTKIKIICPEHKIFEQVPQHHTNGVGCPSCCESKGEKSLVKLLDVMKIEYEREKRFKDCRFKNSLPFDFYIPSLNICIEYDGMQHFRKWDRIGGDIALEKQIIKDQIKNQYCKDNNIKLIRIRYDESIDQDKFEILLK